MQVTVQYFDGCPNWQTAEQHLREALERLGRSDIAIARQQVSSVEQADALAFRGSPTFLIDGRDPFADNQAPVGLSCRVYTTDAGLTGAPTVDQLVAALGS